MDSIISVLQSPLFTTLLVLVAGVVGYYIRFYIDLKRSRYVKTLPSELVVGVKYGNGNFVKPYLNLKLENLSKTRVKVKSVHLKHKSYIGMASIDLIPVNNQNPEIDILEIKSLKYTCGFTRLYMNKENNMISSTEQFLLNSPTEFFDLLYNYLNSKNKPIKSKKDFQKRLQNLGVFIQTNIGRYFHRFSKKERKIFFENSLLKEYNKKFQTNR